MSEEHIVDQPPVEVAETEPAESTPPDQPVEVIPEVKEPERPSGPPVLTYKPIGMHISQEANQLGIDTRLTRPEKRKNRGSPGDNKLEGRPTGNSSQPPTQEDDMHEIPQGTPGTEGAPPPAASSLTQADMERIAGLISASASDVSRAQKISEAEAEEKKKKAEEGFLKRSTKGLGTKLVHTAGQTIVVMGLIGLGYLIKVGIEYFFLPKEDL
jgi:hypothetical protein